MPCASASKSAAHSRRRLVIPAWEKTTYETSYAMGGKGNGIRKLGQLGLRTPAALIISTTLSRSFAETGELPKRFIQQLESEIVKLEQQTGKRFGDHTNPLLVSVRSGAMVSMPGMMETVLNVGLTADVAAKLTTLYGESFVAQCQNHLKNGLGKQYNFVRRDAWAQLHQAIMLVLASWNSPRAKAYREEHNVSEKLGTAITIQEMVFGNLKAQKESGTGVVMSHNPETADAAFFGNYLPFAQGHDLVSGECTPLPLAALEEACPRIAEELKQALPLLEQEAGGPVEVEFTIENGVLYFLQFRKMKFSPTAMIVHAVREKHAGRLTKDEVIDQIPDSVVDAIAHGLRLETSAEETGKQYPVLAKGSGITHNAAVGFLARSEEEVRMCQKHGRPYILLRKSTLPEDFLLMKDAAGIITLEGGDTCHAAVVARHMGIPAVIGIAASEYLRLISSRDLGDTLSIDAQSGTVFKGAVPIEKPDHGKEIALFVRWLKQGHLRPTLKPALCIEKFNVNTLLNSFYIAEAMLSKKASVSPELAKTISQVHRRITAEIAEIFGSYLCLAVASEVTNAREDTEAGSQLKKLRSRGFTLVHRNAFQANVPPAIINELSLRDEATVTEYFSFCRDIFKSAGWSGAMGGKKWATIAETVWLFWSRQITAAMFVDRVFDLEHNTGHVFNKHPMVSNAIHSALLRDQLDSKRRDASVSIKCRTLLQLHSGVDPEVHKCFLEGIKKGKW